ncbi:MAG: alpha/beta fold hydrolase [Burkholderiales bacterium]|nr:alpha/beta fold hydrolase [Burkholderiales bacterium]MDE2566283.1 alpha/beta fold hydrolase [Burkholderiales bacterium]
MRIVARGVAIEVDDQGPPGGEPLLMIMGLGMPLVAWPQELVQGLVTRGFRVLRLDNRDAGLSQRFDERGVPNLATAALRHWLHLPVRAPYRLADMAADALGVLDVLGIARAHVCGASMGGMIAQHLVAAHPERVRSLTLVMTTSGARRLPQPTWAVQRALLARPASPALDDVVAHLQRMLAIIGSPAYPADPDWQRSRLRAMVARGWHPAGTARQLVAVAADGDRTPLLARITAPTCVIHGQADPLVPVAAGHDLAARIAGATADFVPGMGHDLPLQLLPRIEADIAANALR